MKPTLDKTGVIGNPPGLWAVAIPRISARESGRRLGGVTGAGGCATGVNKPPPETAWEIASAITGVSAEASSVIDLSVCQRHSDQQPSREEPMSVADWVHQQLRSHLACLKFGDG